MENNYVLVHYFAVNIYNSIYINFVFKPLLKIAKMNAEIERLKSSQPLVRLFGNEIKSRKYNEVCACCYKIISICNFH